MYKRIISILIILTLTAAAGPDPANSRLGLRLGLGWFGLTGIEDNGTSASNIFGGGFGAFYTHSFVSGLFVQPLLLYVIRGVQKTHSINTSLLDHTESPGFAAQALEATEDVSLGYIQIPVLVGYQIPVDGRLQPRLMAGPSFAFNVSGTDKAEGFGAWDGDHDIGNLKTFDFGAILGAGVTFPVGSLEFDFDVMYDRSFSSAFSDVSEEELANDVNEELWTKVDPVTFERTTEAPDYKNTGFSFHFGMVLPFGK